MKRIAILSFLLCVLASVYGQRISLQPSILEFHLGTPGTQSQSIQITNLSTEKASFTAYLADWLRDSTGGHQYFKADTLSTSCASWVHLNKNFIEIEPGKTGELIVQLQSPSDASQLSRMRWAMLFLQSAEEKDASTNKGKQLQTQIKEILRIGVHIYQTSPVLTNYAAKMVSFKAVPEEKKSYEMVMQNTGDVMLQCKAYMELTNIADGTKYKLDKVEFPVFPSGVRKVKLAIPDNIPVGNYSALAILDLGEDIPLEAIEQTIAIK